MSHVGPGVGPLGVVWRTRRLRGRSTEHDQCSRCLRLYNAPWDAGSQTRLMQKVVRRCTDPQSDTHRMRSYLICNPEMVRVVIIFGPLALGIFLNIFLNAPPLVSRRGERSPLPRLWKRLGSRSPWLGFPAGR
jgi:hypothetical protein